MTVSTSVFYSDSVLREMADFFCDKRLGAGIAREVWTLATNPDYVIKVEDVRESFQNVLEWETWRQVKYTRWSKWFAPCKFISKTGRILIQERTTPIVIPPKRIPAFFTDLKASNWGMLNGRFVAHDYAINRLQARGLTDAMRVTKVRDWSSYVENS